MPMNFFMNVRKADEARLAFYGVAAVFAGFAGGLLGAGAGLFLFMICRRIVGGKVQRGFMRRRTAHEAIYRLPGGDLR